MNSLFFSEIKAIMAKIIPNIVSKSDSVILIRFNIG